MRQNFKTQRKVLKVLLSRNPNCSGYATYFFILGLNFVQFLFSLFGGHFLYHHLSSLSQEKIHYWIKRAKRNALIIFGLTLLACILLKIFPELFFYFIFLFIPLSILFGFCFGISFWYLKFFENHPKAKFVLFPILIWLGMLLYTIVLLLLLTFIGLF